MPFSVLFNTSNTKRCYKIESNYSINMQRSHFVQLHSFIKQHRKQPFLSELTHLISHKFNPNPPQQSLSYTRFSSM